MTAEHLFPAPAVAPGTRISTPRSSFPVAFGYFVPAPTIILAASGTWLSAVHIAVAPSVSGCQDAEGHVSLGRVGGVDSLLLFHYTLFLSRGTQHRLDELVV